MTTETPGDAHVEVRGITKRFSGVQALLGVDLAVARGEIHGLVGENGAGKSTLGRIIAGVIRPDEGELFVDGSKRSYRSPREALRDGITGIQQEIALLPKRTVIENVFLGFEASVGRGLVDDRAMTRRFEELDAKAGFGLDPKARAGALSTAEQQKVEILQALARGARLIVMDEPTAKLTGDEASKLHEIMRELRASGTTIVYVSHFIEEVLSLVDTVSVLRNGELVRTAPAAEEAPETLVTAMLGQPAELTFPGKTLPGPEAPVVLSVEGLRRGWVVEDVSFELRAGEILGIAGLVGSGRSEVARAIYGADRRDGGTIRVEGRTPDIRSTRHAVKAGIHMLPEDRKNQGLLMRLSVRDNVSLPHLKEVSAGGLIKRGSERAASKELVERLDVKPPRPGVITSKLSGGNQQKVLFAKWLFRRPVILIADEPTRGVDVGAKRAIYQLLTDLASEGMGVLLISSEFEEIVGLAHRSLVMHRGRVVAEFGPQHLTYDALMRAAFASESAGAGDGS